MCLLTIQTEKGAVLTTTMLLQEPNLNVWAVQQRSHHVHILRMPYTIAKEELVDLLRVMTVSYLLHYTSMDYAREQPNDYVKKLLQTHLSGTDFFRQRVFDLVDQKVIINKEV